MEDKELFLIYVNPIGKDSNDVNEYEFFFSETPEIVWGEDWNVACPSACGNLLPDSSTYSVIKHLKTHMPLFCARYPPRSSCYHRSKREYIFVFLRISLLPFLFLRSNLEE